MHKQDPGRGTRPQRLSASGRLIPCSYKYSVLSAQHIKLMPPTIAIQYALPFARCRPWADDAGPQSRFTTPALDTAAATDLSELVIPVSLKIE